MGCIWNLVSSYFDDCRLRLVTDLCTVTIWVRKVLDNGVTKLLSDFPGQACTAGSRIFVQEGIYDEFLTKFTAITKNFAAATGDPFDIGTQHGPQISQVQFDVRLSFSPSLYPMEYAAFISVFLKLTNKLTILL